MHMYIYIRVFMHVRVYSNTYESVALLDSSKRKLRCGASEIHCVAVCCSVLQYVAACCSASPWVTFTVSMGSEDCTLTHTRNVLVVCCSVLYCVAVCCSVLQCEAVCCSVLQHAAVCCSVLQRVAESRMVSHSMYPLAVCCSVLQRVAACYSLLQCNMSQFVALCRTPCIHWQWRLRAGAYKKCCCSVS